MNEKSEKPAFTLAMLGTDTNFFPNLKKVGKKKTIRDISAYPKGETLSIIATLIHTNIAAEPDPHFKEDIPFQAEEVVVINGPDTAGTKVGGKIGLGLAAALKAIASAKIIIDKDDKGKFPINIIAHSRGAVESILIAHELEAVQQIIGSCSNIKDVIDILHSQHEQRNIDRKKADSKNKYYNTPPITNHLSTHLNNYLKTLSEDEKKTWFESLQKNIPNASINFFGIDPVPGDCYPITWYDDRYSTVPTIVENAQMYYYENERTDLGFTPIYPNLVDPEKQNLVRDTIPGHHGTGSAGNNASQQQVQVSTKGEKTTDVQKLLIYKLLDFLNQKKSNVTFKKPQILYDKNTALGRKHLNPDSEIKDFDFPAIYKSLYKIIAKNRSAYNEFNKTSYKFMGVVPQRRVLLKGHTYGTLNEMFPISSSYVNGEHALMMQEAFLDMFFLSSEEPKSLSDLASKAHEVIKYNIEKVLHGEKINRSLIDDNNKLVNLTVEDVRKGVLGTFEIVIARISQQYMTNDWSSPENQQKKQELFNAIIAMLKDFTSYKSSENATMQKFASDLINLSLSGIKHIIEQQSIALTDNYNRLQQPVEKQFELFFTNNMKLIVLPEEAAERLKNVNSRALNIVTSAEFKNLPEHSLQSKIHYLCTQLELTEDEKAQLISEFQGYCGDLESFDKLYQQIQIFISDLIGVSPLFENYNTFAPLTVSLIQKSQLLIDTAAQKFYRDLPDTLPDVALPNTFRELAERHAINHYQVTDRVKEELSKETKDKAELTQQITTERQAAETKQRELQEQITALNSPEEARRALIITEKLIPLTNDYLTLLKDKSDDDKVLRVSNLLAILHNIDDFPLPSKRMNAFYTQLNTDQDELKKHNDPDWKRYVKNVLVVAGIFLSGILIGLAALAAYTKVGNSSVKSAYFWRSEGKNVVDKLKDEELPSPSKPEENDAPENGM